MQNYVLFFSHSPQIKWFALMAQVLRHRFGLASVLWVIGEEDRLEGEKTSEFADIVDLVGNEPTMPMLHDLEQAVEILTAFEKERGEAFLNQDIAMDRYVALARWPLNHTLLYAGTVLQRMRCELERQSMPLFAVGEENTLPYRLARRLVTAPYFCPHIVGHLGDRFYFEYSIYEQWTNCQEYYNRFSSEGIPTNLRERAQRCLDDLIAHRLPPAEMVRFHARGGNSLRRKLTFSIARRVFLRTFNHIGSHKNPWNPRRRSILQDNPIRSAHRAIVATQRKRFFKSLIMKKLPTDRSFAAFFLHMQPEHTVDGLAFEYRDQAATAHTIAAALPVGMLLLVKEHPTMVGLRPVEFYEDLCSCPNIVLLDDAVSSYEVVVHAKLMFTLTGSVALESMYLGKPVIVLGQIYHSAFRGIHLVDNIRCLSTRVRELLDYNNENATKEDAITALAAMYAASHPGKFGSQYASTEMSEATNLDAIAESLKREFSLQCV